MTLQAHAPDERLTLIPVASGRGLDHISYNIADAQIVCYDI